MKIFLYCMLCLLLLGCGSEKAPQEDSFLVETQMTEDMRKIKDAFVESFKIERRFFFEKKLKIAKAIHEFYGKDNMRLKKEFAEICEYYSEDTGNLHGPMEKLINERYNAISARKGRKLNCDQVLALTIEFEKAQAEIIAHEDKLYTPYKTKVEELRKDALIKNDRYGWKAVPEYGWMLINGKEDDYNKFYSYGRFSSWLFSDIKRGTLKDSFLKRLPSPLEEEEEYLFFGNVCRVFDEICETICNIAPIFHGEEFPTCAEERLSVFDFLKNSVKDTTIERGILARIVGFAKSYLEKLALCIADMHGNVVGKIDRMTLDESPDKHLLIGLVEKYPKLEDFEKQIDALSARFAYITYYEAKTVRALYMEWLRSYMSQMGELFKNSRILAERLHNLCKDEKISKNDVDGRNEHEWDIKNIAIIREITSMGPKKIIKVPNRPVDSQKKIKDAYKNSFMKMRESHLRHMGQTSI